MKELYNKKLIGMNIYNSWNQEELPSVLWTTNPKESKKIPCSCGQVYIGQMVHHIPTRIWNTLDTSDWRTSNQL
jgi:hypothetical protein